MVLHENLRVFLLLGELEGFTAGRSEWCAGIIIKGGVQGARMVEFRAVSVLVGGGVSIGVGVG
jgi:hypothetical protein